MWSPGVRVAVTLHHRLMRPTLTGRVFARACLASRDGRQFDVRVRSRICGIQRRNDMGGCPERHVPACGSLSPLRLNVMRRLGFPYAARNDVAAKVARRRHSPPQIYPLDPDWIAGYLRATSALSPTEGVQDRPVKNPRDGELGERTGMPQRKALIRYMRAMRDDPPRSSLLPVVSATAIEYLKREGIDVDRIGKRLFGSSWEVNNMTHEHWRRIIQSVEEESLKEDV